MKRAIAIALVLALTVSMITACGFNSLVGTWSATIDGTVGEMTLQRDGSGTVTSSGVTRSCRWLIIDDTLTVIQEMDGEEYVFLDKVTYTVKKGVLTVTSQSGNTLTFEKK